MQTAWNVFSSVIYLRRFVFEFLGLLLTSKGPYLDQTSVQNGIDRLISTYENPSIYSVNSNKTIFWYAVKLEYTRII
jgi:hypothetical protein